MPWEAQFIEWLQRASCGFLDASSIGLTYLGDEIFFLVVALILYWCIDKRFAFRLITVYIGGVSVCEGLKGLVGRPRPFDAYADSVRSIGSKTSGYSFPSGHSQSISNLSTQSYLQYRKTRAGRPILIAGICAVVVVMLTRLYLGQHYLTDVLTGLCLGVASALAFTALFRLLGEREERLLYGVLPLTVILTVIVLSTGLAARMPDAVKVLGGYGAVTLGYFLEKRYVGYNVRSDRWWKYALKMLLGLALVLALKEGLKAAFAPIPNETLAVFLSGYVRYFLLGLAASWGLPALFKAARL